MSEPPIIINELLTFIQNKVDILDELSIVQICVTSFKDTEIDESKTVLANALPDSNSRTIKRKGDDKSKKNIKDIIKLFKENEPSLQPIFVARNLNKLPPVTFDHVDVSRLLKDISSIKSELQTIRNDAASISELNTLQSTISSNLSGLRSSITKLDSDLKKSNKVQQVNKEIDKGPELSTTPKRQINNECTDNRLSHAPVASMHSRSRSGETSRTQPQYVSQAVVNTPSYRDIIVRPQQIQATTNRIDPNNKDENDFTLVSYKKRKTGNANRCGTAKMISKIQVADLSSAVYISRLSKSTSIDDIKDHILNMKETCTDVHVLTQQRETEFNSYKVIIPKSKLNTFLSNEFWPEGVRYRIFREYPKRITVSKTI